MNCVWPPCHCYSIINLIKTNLLFKLADWAEYKWDSILSLSHSQILITKSRRTDAVAIVDATLKPTRLSNTEIHFVWRAISISYSNSALFILKPTIYVSFAMHSHLQRSSTAIFNKSVSLWHYATTLVDTNSHWTLKLFCLFFGKGLIL